MHEQLRLVDQLGREASPGEGEQMTSHFMVSSRYESVLGDQAYRLVGWPG